MNLFRDTESLYFTKLCSYDSVTLQWYRSNSIYAVVMIIKLHEVSLRLINIFPLGPLFWVLYYSNMGNKILCMVSYYKQ